MKTLRTLLAASFLVLGLASTSALSGCAPRGETKTLDEVLTEARDRFRAVSSKAANSQAQGSVNSLATKLDLISQAHGSLAANEVGAIADILQGLSLHAGYPSRPAIAELETQYRELSASAAGPSSAVAKLLAARTFTLVAGELETSAFSL